MGRRILQAASGEEGEKPSLVRGVTWAESGRRKGPEWVGMCHGGDGGKRGRGCWSGLERAFS